MINLGILICKSGTAQDIFNELKKLLDEYKAWQSVKMIISDTTAVNTGYKNGIVTRLQKEFQSKGLLEPQFIGCQNHILDLILRHLLDFFTPTASQKPQMNYDFVEIISVEYYSLQEKYVGDIALPIFNNLGWRDDFRYLFEICEAYKLHISSNKFPIIKWRKLPCLNNARWNSRGTFALMAYFLLPDYRKKLKPFCNFISTTWASAWFSNQIFDGNVYDKLLTDLLKLNCTKAINCLQKHWVNQPSVLDVPRSNIISERAVKIMEDIHATCKNDKYLHLKFVNSNKNLVLFYNICFNLVIFSFVKINVRAGFFKVIIKLLTYSELAYKSSSFRILGIANKKKS